MFKMTAIHPSRTLDFIVCPPLSALTDIVRDPSIWEHLAQPPYDLLPAVSSPSPPCALPYLLSAVTARRQLDLYFLSYTHNFSFKCPEILPGCWSKNKQILSLTPGYLVPTLYFLLVSLFVLTQWFLLTLCPGLCMWTYLLFS